MLTSTYEVFRITNSSDSVFSSTISGTPGATLVFNAPTGNEDSIVPTATNQLEKLILWNTTKTPDEYALISSVDTGTNTITPTATITGWSNSEAIQVNSPIVTGTINSCYCYDLQIADTSVIPQLATSLVMEGTAYDTGGTAAIYIHPHISGALDTAKLQTITTPVANVSSRKYIEIELYNRRFDILYDATGTATLTPVVLRCLGFEVATP